MIESFSQADYEMMNDPEGFICPLPYPTETDIENFMWMYFRLSNNDDFYTRRCFGILYNTLNEEF